MANDVHASIIIGSDSSQAKKDMDSFSKTAIKQWNSIEKAIKKAGGTIAQVEQGLEELGAGDLLGKLGKGLQLSSNEMKSLRSVIARVGYDVEQAQAKAALSTQVATQKIQEQTKATNALAESTKKAGKAKKDVADAARPKTSAMVAAEQERGVNQVGRQLGQLEIGKQQGEQDRLTIETREQERRWTKLYEFELDERGRALRKLQKVEQEVVSESVALQNRLTSAIKASNLAYERAQMVAGGMRPSEALQQQLNAASFQSAAARSGIRTGATPNTRQWQQEMNAAIQQQLITVIASTPPTLRGVRVNATAWQKAMNQAIFSANADYLAQSPPQVIAPRSPRLNAAAWQKAMNQAIFNSNSNYLSQAAVPQFPAAGGAGGGGVWKKILGTLGFGSGGGFTGSLVRNIAGATGIGAGAYGVMQAGQAAVSAAEAATAYDRMEVSARKLAGSQAELNSLMQAYEEASGGAVDQATALEAVIKLQATGFANSAAEVERFVRGARGAALSLGKPQENITQETQLAISNTSVKRLDQIGLGIAEVDKRTKELRQTNKGWTREMAFQEAVIGLLNEKYGALSDTVEGQATPLEKLGTTWDNLVLSMGQGLQRPLADMAGWIDTGIKKTLELVDAFEKVGDVIRNAGRHVIGLDPFSRPTTPNVTDSEMMARSGRKPAVDPFSEEKQQLAIQRAETLERIERDSGQAIVDADREYHQSLVDTNNSYYKTLARDNEDYQRSRAKSEAAFARSIAEVQEDAKDREVEAARDLMNQIVRMNRDAAREEARARRDLNRSIEKMHEDHADKVKDIEEEYQRSLEEAREDSTERLQEMQVDYDEKITEAREDSVKRLEELEKDYNKDREKSREQHNLSMLEAAASLDAKAMWLEDKKFALETKQAQEAHQEAIDKEKKNLDEFEDEAQKDHNKAIANEKKRLKEFEEEAKESHERRLKEETDSLQERENEEKESLELRLEDARENLRLQQEDLIAAHAAQKKENDAADGKRLTDMKAAHKLEQDEADADYGIRLGRLAQDHIDQLKELGNQHTARITQIGEHAQAERDALEAEQKKSLHQLGVFIEGHTLLYEQMVLDAERAFDEWLLHIEEQLATEGRGGLTEDEYNRYNELEKEKVPWQAIIDDPNASQEDKNLAQRQINRITGEQIEIQTGHKPPEEEKVKLSETPYSLNGTPVPPVSNSATTGATVGGGIVIQSGAVQITAYPGQSPASLGDEFETRLLSVVKRLSKVAL